VLDPIVVAEDSLLKYRVNLTRHSVFSRLRLSIAILVTDDLSHCTGHARAKMRGIKPHFVFCDAKIPRSGKPHDAKWKHPERKKKRSSGKPDERLSCSVQISEGNSVL
jgi:hypothetical protein